jgi:glutamate-5-semialdehyde dehydrogenase
MSTAEILTLPALMADIGHKARIGAHALAIATAHQKQMALTVAAGAINAHRKAMLAANAKDMAAAQAKGISKAFLDRLLLTDARIDGIIEALNTIAGLPDPVGTVIAEWDRPNGLHIERIRSPLGVIGVIFESRPNVTADAGALCIKSGNAVILIPPQCHRRRRRAVHQVGQCGDPPWRQRQLPFEPGHRRLHARRPARRRVAGGMPAAGADHRS